jgi:hypothetical protein
MSNSCVGCKFLFGDGDGYSNYTWMDTYVRCAKGNNKLLDDANEPSDWTGREDNPDPEKDNWPKTKEGRCSDYSVGPYITLDPDREINLDEDCPDEEQRKALKEFM